MTATLHPVLWIVFWIFAPGFTLCALALICYAVFGPPTGVEKEEDIERKRLQAKWTTINEHRPSFLDRMDENARNRTADPEEFRGDAARFPWKGRVPEEQAALDQMNAMSDEEFEALGRQSSPPASAVQLALQGGQEPIRKDGSPDAGETAFQKAKEGIDRAIDSHQKEMDGHFDSLLDKLREIGKR